MENKTHWVFDYIINQDKENKEQITNLNENININETEFPINLKGRNNFKNSKSKDKQTFILKDSKLKNSNAVVSSDTNNFNINFPKSLNLKKNLTREEEDSEPNSLSFNKHFNLQYNNKPKSFKNYREFNNPTNNYNNSFNNSFLSTNLNNQNNLNSSKTLLNRNDKNISAKSSKNQRDLENKNDIIHKKLESSGFLPITKPLNSYKSGQGENKFTKRVSFSNINQVISEDIFSSDHILLNKDSDKNNFKNQYCTYQNTNRKTLKNEPLKKNESKTELKQGSLIDLYDKERIKKELNQEFDIIFDDLEILKKFSEYTMMNSSPSFIDDMRVSFLDFTTNLEIKRNEIENSIKKNKNI